MTERQYDRRVNLRLRLDPKMVERLRVLAKAQGLTVPVLMRQTMQRLLDKNKERLDEIARQLDKLDID
jgi:predicted transcriptional regulator